MKRILIIGVGLAFLVGIFAFAGEPAAMAQTIELKFAHFMSPMHIQHQKSFQPFCDNVAKLTDGRVKIKIYPGGALGRPKQLPDAAKTGVTDIAFIIPSYTTGRFPRLSALDLPFLVESAEHATRVIYDLYDRYFFEDFTDYKVLWFYSCGTCLLYTSPSPRDLSTSRMPSSA